MRMGNQQDYNLTNNQLQVLLSGYFGDGSITITENNKGIFTTNSIYKEYIKFKDELLGNLTTGRIRESVNRGFKQNLIYNIGTVRSDDIRVVYNLPIEKKLELLDDLGLALWFYDDGSLHKKNYFYNLNTHSFDEYTHYNIFVPYFESKGLHPKVFRDKKKDGREFCYLYFGKHFGAFEIAQLLEKYPFDCFKYKLWSSETIQKWSKLKAELKSRNMVITPRKFENIILGKSTI